MRLIKDGKQPVILIADNTPLYALSAIDNLDWLLVPGVRVQITDQVMIEADDFSGACHETRFPLWQAISLAEMPERAQFIACRLNEGGATAPPAFGIGRL